jgi:hypothetical protein
MNDLEEEDKDRLRGGTRSFTDSSTAATSSSWRLTSDGSG